MEYDVENHLTKVISASGTTEFRYDSDGKRVKKISADETVIYVSGSYEIRATSDERRIIKHIFTGSDRSITVEKTQGQTHTYYCHNDHLGSTNVITDENGFLVQSCEYTPYGEVASNTGTYNSPYKFTSKELDDFSGLYYYGARYYDAVLCHFIQADTIVPEPLNPQSFNRYSYCYNNPLIYTDPSGNFGFLAILIGAIIGAIVGGVAAAAAGGDVGRGILFGALVGAATTMFTGAALHIMNTAFASGGISAMENAFITGVEFAIGGFGSGLITGYGGGAGNSSSMFKSAFIGAGIGFVTGGIIGYSYQAGWQDILHGNDSRLINKLQEQAKTALAHGDIATYADAAMQLQELNAPIPQPKSILGVYINPNTPGIYPNNPIIYQDKQISMYGGSVGDVINFASEVGRGEALAGSTKIVVYGIQETMTPTHWQVASWDKLAISPSTQRGIYGWEPVSEKVANRLFITTKARIFFKE